jgi:cysteine synthase A
MDAPNACTAFDRGRIFDSILDTIGNTPLIRLSRLAEETNCLANLLGKGEFFNPLSSVKDRIGLAMVDAAEHEGRVGPDAVLVEPTSGNTGIALAFVCARRGYRLILTMPESMSVERRKMLALLRAEIVLTPAVKGMPGAIARAGEIVESTPGAIMLQQFANPANPEVHRRTTAEEIWRDTNGRVDVIVSGVGTGGTITGCGEVLKARIPGLRIIAVEPEDSPSSRAAPPARTKFKVSAPASFPPCWIPVLSTRSSELVTKPRFSWHGVLPESRACLSASPLVLRWPPPLRWAADRKWQAKP